MNTKREVLQAFEDFQKGLLGTIPAMYKDEATRPSNRGGEGIKLGSNSADEAKAKSGIDVRGVHGAPTEIQEG